MKNIQILILTLISLTSYAADEPSNPFDEIITKELLIQFSTFEKSTNLEVHREIKNDLTVYSFSVGPYPVLGIHISVGPAYSLLPKGKIKEDRKAVSEGNHDLEKIIEAKKDELTEEEYQEAKKSLKLFSTIMAGSDEERYPELGSQALQTGWTDGDTIVFTTTDIKYDLKIQRTFTEGTFFRVPEMAQRISDTYDKTRPQPVE
jgi:hypothetical protein